MVNTHSLRKLNRSHTRLSFRPIGRASHCALSMHDGRVPGSPHLCVIRPHSRCEAWVLNMMKPVGVLGTGALDMPPSKLTTMFSPRNAWLEPFGSPQLERGRGGGRGGGMVRTIAPPPGQTLGSFTAFLTFRPHWVARAFAYFHAISYVSPPVVTRPDMPCASSIVPIHALVFNKSL